MNKQKECEHGQTRQGKAERTFLGESFNIKTPICKDCGAVLWTDQTEMAYNRWLGMLFKEKRDRFQVQYTLSENLIGCVEHLRERFPGIKLTELLRTIVMVYINTIDTNQELSKQVESAVNGRVEASLTEAPKVKGKIQFKPAAMQDLVTVSEFAGLANAQVVEHSILRIMAMFMSEDPGLRKFWEENIATAIASMLKVA